jgi:hypothetical protein
LATPWHYVDEFDLRSTFARHLTQWLDRWIGVPEICEETMWKIPPKVAPSTLLRENRLHAILLHFDLDKSRDLASRLGAMAVAAYQRSGPDGYGKPLSIQRSESAEIAALIDGDMPRESWSSLIRDAPSDVEVRPLSASKDGIVRFAAPEWFYFFCAVGLLDAIVTGGWDAVERHPYVNNTHQYLAALVERYSEKRSRVIATLSEWLTGATSAGRGRPIVRNFAAYVLGMISAVEAEDELAQAARDDQGQDVPTYAICALAKLRSRRHLGLLVRLRGRASDERQRLLIGQAICRITGVAHYEL